VLSLLAGLLWLAQAAQAPPPGPPSPPLPVYVPERVYDTRKQAFTDLESMLADVAKADIVFVGEQHDDPNTHRLEAAILDGLRRRGVAVTLSLEMFERDTQADVDGYLAGKVPEEEFLKISRPWPRYSTDYRALVEIAKAQGWPVVASNVPRRIASSVAKTGLTALETLTPADRAWAAADIRCPRDAYFERFAEQMNGHQASPGDKNAAPAQGSTNPSTPANVSSQAKAPEQKKPPTPAEVQTTERYYFSQCVKDETMAEAIANAFERHGRKPVVQITGAFHSDFGQGTAERVRRRLPDRRLAVVSVLPVKDLDTLAPAGEDLKRGDFLLYTIAAESKK
jgi:uncharacterized iron-regulated protein